MNRWIVRNETPADYQSIEQLNKRAFGGPDESRLIRNLRGIDSRIISMVALDRERVVGHIMFTPVTAEGADGRTPAAALGPMAVDPAVQKHGIGSTLVRAGLEATRAAGEKLVFVLGHERYYPRFGFEPAAPRGFHFRSAKFDPYFMLLELVPGSAPRRGGMVNYLPAFDEF